MRKQCTCFATISLAVLILTSRFVTADIGPTKPFEGDGFENFTSLLGMPAHVSTIEIFDNLVTVNNITDGGSLFIASGSSLGGDWVHAYSSPLAVAQLGISEWNFHEPIVRFGAYFENNSHVDDAIIQFYDISGKLLGSEVVTVSTSGQSWVWNGWESGNLIHRIVVIGNNDDFLNGFIWFDDVQISHPAEFGDVNRDGSVDLLDVGPFVEILADGDYQVEADLNQDDVVNLLDITPLVDAIGS